MSQPVSAIFDSKHAYGYFSANDKSLPEKLRKKEEFSKIRLLKNVTNILSIFLSPIVGIVRVILATIALCNLNKKEKKGGELNDFDKGVCRLMKASVGRGVLEILCLGPILGIVDAVKTVQHHEMCCYKKA